MVEVPHNVLQDARELRQFVSFVPAPLHLDSLLRKFLSKFDPKLEAIHIHGSFKNIFIFSSK